MHHHHHQILFYTLMGVQVPMIIQTNQFFITSFLSTIFLQVFLLEVRCLALSSVSPLDSSATLTPSIHLPLGLPLGLFPSIFASNICFANLCSPILFTCPYHLKLDLLTFSYKLTISILFLISSFEIRSCH